MTNIQVTSTTQDVFEIKDRYIKWGYRPIPLKQGEKRPIEKIRWARDDPQFMWGVAKGGENIGLRCGGSSWFAVLDCDDKNHPDTYDNVCDYLRFIGFDLEEFPIIQTASGNGRHIYFKLTSRPEADLQHIHESFGEGEVRYGDGCYVVAPPSIVDGNTYQLISGDLEHLPELSYEELQPLIRYKNGKELECAHKAPRSVWKILKNQSDKKYKSRSEAEFAMIVGLVNVGFTDEEIKGFFLINQPPKFKELYETHDVQAFTYLDHSIKNARKWVAENESEGRRIASEIRQRVLTIPWKREYGLNNRSVLLAHSQIAYRCGKLEYIASSRGIADIANTSKSSAGRGTNTLVKKGFLDLVTPAEIYFAAKYRIKQIDTPSQLLLNTVVGECIDLLTHDAFRRDGLGKLAGEIFLALNQQPMKVSQLRWYTGRSESSVRRALRKAEVLAKQKPDIGFHLDVNQEGLWKLKLIDINELASMLGVFGKRFGQIRKHQRERALYKKGFERIFGKEVENDESSK